MDKDPQRKQALKEAYLTLERLGWLSDKTQKLFFELEKELEEELLKDEKINEQLSFREI